MTQRFLFAMVKPSHYDDQGYVIQWVRAAMPSNTLATLCGIAEECRDRRALGPDVELELATYDETNTRIRVDRIARRIREAGGGLVGLVGVQSNQFPRAMDLAREFRRLGIQVCIGGFHVSGSLAMVPGGTPPELQEAMDLGISLFSGEAEGRLDVVLRDALAGTLEPLYDFRHDLPSLEGATTPILAIDRVKRTVGSQASFDAGRGCPFQCSFCTIINVQGRKSRFRNADDIERIVRANLEQGIRRFFITDDNFARNKNWESIFDRLIELRERDGLYFRLVLQVDTLCHGIPGFIEKSGRAGVKRVFIGLENINPTSLKGAKKAQNRITEYRDMLLAWRGIGVITTAGYILGFPGDTPESIEQDIRVIQRELPIDMLEFFFLTPLPGSEDHARLHGAGVPMDPDLNKYDLNHVTTAHGTMSKSEWERAYRLAWDTYFSREHVEVLLRRARASGLNLGKILATYVSFYGSVLYEGVHPLESGILRMRYRRDRRPGMKREAPGIFHAKAAGHFLATLWHGARLYLRFLPLRRKLERDPLAAEYTDLALTPWEGEAEAELELYNMNPATRDAVAKERKRSETRRAAGSAPK